jgi:hypothetical protein
MTISNFVKYVYDLARKEGKGNVVTPAVIVNWLTYVMLDNFNDLLTQALTLAQERQVALANVIFDIKDLRQFIKSDTLVPVSYTIGNVHSAKAPLPSDFKYELGLTADMVNVDLLSYTLLPKYRGSVLNGNPEESPKAFIGGGYLEVIPNDLNGLVFVYLRTPAKPYYDFCMDSADNEIFMPAGSTIQYNAPQDWYDLYSESGVLMASDITKTGVQYPGTCPYTSLTVELDWDEMNHVRFANVVAHKLGINLKNPILTQTQ